MFRTRVVAVDPFEPDEGLLGEAARVIRSGGLVVFPTETVYGLGANAYSREAVIKIFKAKNRPMDNPLIVHICGLEELEMLASKLPDEAYEIAEKLWPGPVTLVVWKSEQVLKEVTAGLPKVAIRMPSHPIASSLIRLSGVPIAAPSANLAGRPSPTTAHHAIQDLYGRVDLIIDGGETLFGVESTIIDLTVKPPRLLRPGPIPVEDLERVLGFRIGIPDYARGLSEAKRAYSPGVKYRHYAPETPMKLVESDSYDDLAAYASKLIEIAEECSCRGLKVVIVASRETSRYYSARGFQVLELGSRKNLYEVARNLFKTLRELDEVSPDLALCEGFEEKGLGLTIMNRLRKACKHDIIRV
ncbi:MAG: threonylcarbamoyl-AMP synthase [Thaumarchaeota archaeon]|nr:threonylcarbamoyl-AMP synthase [Nitrososphaerota archaeon]